MKATYGMDVMRSVGYSVTRLCLYVLELSAGATRALNQHTVLNFDKSDRFNGTCQLPLSHSSQGYKPLLHGIHRHRITVSRYQLHRP